MKVLRKIIEIDEELCDGCGQCVPACAEGAIQIVDGKARIVSERYCDGLGACMGECPQGALHIVEREAEDFDEEAVEAYLKEREAQAKPAESPSMPCGCPSSQIQQFIPQSGFASAEAEPSGLSHWPVQIRLVPAHAPFLKEADLLVAADCVPVAYPSFHRDFLQGRAIMVGCPKFDDGQEIVQKFVEVFTKNNIKGVTVVIMEVPCCGGLPMMLRKAMELAKKSVPMEQVVVGTRGKTLARQRIN